MSNVGANEATAAVAIYKLIKFNNSNKPGRQEWANILPCHVRCLADCDEEAKVALVPMIVWLLHSMFMMGTNDFIIG